MADTPADNDNIERADATGPNGRPLSPAALRALKEAEERRSMEAPQEQQVEHGGRGGADPARFGDWEINGRAIDF